MRIEVIILLVVSSVLLISSTIFLGGYGFSQKKIVTGLALTGSLSLSIEQEGIFITIASPLNTTYNFFPGIPYILSLNVTSSSNISTWRFALIDVRHNIVVNSSTVFTPNITFTAARWSNLLVVNATSTDNVNGSAQVYFYINVSNTAPLITNLSQQALACEDQSFQHFFNVTDPDEDDILISLDDPDPFFVTPFFVSGQTLIPAQVISSSFTKSQVGLHQKTIFVNDGIAADSKQLNITVIEINNAPVVTNVSGVYTVWTSGENSNLVIQPVVSDAESGTNLTSGSFTQNLTFRSGTAFFNLSSNGMMNVTANSSLLGVYNVTYCVTDRALSSIHQNISYCGQTGLNKTSCKNFSLTVTNENRQPTITSYTPLNLTFNATDGETLSFTVTTYDPDGTVPDVSWYVDNSLTSTTSAVSTSGFSYSFGCGIGGNHTVRAVATDGQLNDSVQWNMTVTAVDCPTTVSGAGTGGGGGGGEGGGFCQPAWGCDTWNTCQNTDASLQGGGLSGEDYREVKDRCERSTLLGSSCGFQLRTCLDLKSCNGTYVNKPDEISECHYTSNPACNDGIKNCHSGSCELLTDCGGPCSACPTCSDGIQNQAERGVDCGGPCPSQCPPTKLKFIQERDNIRIFLFILNLLLILIIFIIIIRIVVKYLRSKLDKNLPSTAPR